MVHEESDSEFVDVEDDAESANEEDHEYYMSPQVCMMAKQYVPSPSSLATAASSSSLSTLFLNLVTMVVSYHLMITEKMHISFSFFVYILN